MRSCHSVFTDQFIFRTVLVRANNQGNMSGNTGGQITLGRGKFTILFQVEGKKVGNKFCKIANDKHGDITGIYRKKGFIKGETLKISDKNKH